MAGQNRYSKSAITRFCNQISNYQGSHAEFSRGFEFPENKVALETFIAEKRAALTSFTSRISELLDRIQAESKTAIERIYAIPLELRQEVDDDFFAYMQSKDELLTKADQWVADAKHRLKEIEEQARRLKRVQLSGNPTGRSPQLRIVPAEGEEEDDDYQSANGDAVVTNQRQRLPALKIPHFQGNFKEFPSFWASFQSMVHDIETLSDLDKFLFLKQALRGDALKSVAAIPTTSENYSKAVTLLQSIYDKGDSMLDVTMAELRCLPTATNKTKSWRDTLQAIQRITTTLECQGMTFTDKGMWRQLILSKFPYTVHKHIVTEECRENDGEVFEVDDLIVQLSDFVTMSEKIEIATQAINPQSTNGKPEHNSNHQPQKSDRHRNDGPSKDKQRPKQSSNRRRPASCICGDASHVVFKCPTLTTASSRRKHVKENKKCEKCFSDHSTKDCSWSACPECGGAHNRALCDESEKKWKAKWGSNPPPGNPRSARESKPPQNQVITFPVQRLGEDHQISSSQVPLGDPEEQPHQFVVQVVQALLLPDKNGQALPVTLFLDTGAQRSFIKPELSNRFNLPVLRKDISFHICGYADKESHFVSNEVSVRLASLQNPTEPHDLSIHTGMTTGPLRTAFLSSDDLDFIREQQLPLAQRSLGPQTLTPDILIGQDLLAHVVHRQEPNIILPSGLMLSPTVFGYTVSGSSALPRPCVRQDVAYPGVLQVQAPITLNQAYEEYKQDIKNLYELEALGIRTDKDCNEDAVLKFMKEYRQTISFDGGVATAGFPFLDSVKHLQSNYGIAIKRLQHLIHDKLRKSPDMFSMYCQVLEDYLKQGIVEEVPTIQPETEQESEPTAIYYMPHRGVYSPGKTTPLRIVFDASAKGRSCLSLNDVVFKGYSIISDIYDVLLDFRLSEFCMVADIQKAFLQIRLPVEHRDVTRFLWIKDVTKSPTGDNIRTLRFTRVPFGINVSPAILNQVILKHLELNGSTTASEIARSIYVDNVVLHGRSTEDLVKKYTESKRLFSDIGMNLRDYLSNNSQAQDQILPVDRCDKNAIKVLGIPWNSQEDTFELHLADAPPVKWTKKSVLSVINGSCYDPLGLLTPLFTEAKIFLQDLHKKKLGWHDQLDEPSTAKWTSIYEAMKGFSVTIPRPVTTFVGVQERRLSIFCDSSQRSYACVAYLTTVSADSAVSRIFTAKGKVAPIKGQTIPRLELMAIHIGARLAESCLGKLQEQNITVSRVDIFSDSTIALGWVKSLKALPSVVTQLVQKIQLSQLRLQELAPVQFHHVPTTENIADVATRGLDRITAVDHIWFSGPEWLNSQPGKWPTTSYPSFLEQLSSEETFEVAAPTVHELPTAPKFYADAGVWPISRYSNLRKLKRVVAYGLRFCHRDQLHESLNISGPEMAAAEIQLILQEQRKVDIDFLRRTHKEKDIRQDDQGVLRRFRRLENAALSFDACNPIFLPKKSALCKLLIQDLHEKKAHCGVNQLLNELRQRFWIQSDRSLCKKVVKECRLCRVHNGLPYRYPDPGPLQAVRVQPSPAFTHTGVDLCGPFLVHQDNQEVKRWVALFTCMATRLIHLEVVENLSAQAFLMALKRFFSVRGVPRSILSDNGTNFRLCGILLGQGETAPDAVDDGSPDSSVSTYLANYHIEWSFIPPGAPWQGGLWERLVGLVKQALTKSVGRRRLSTEHFRTVVAEVSAIVNCRPLTYSGEDGLALRPVDLLQPHIKLGTNQLDAQDDADDPEYLPQDLLRSRSQALRALGEVQLCTDRFWTKWKNEYLTTLRSGDLHTGPQYRSCNLVPKVGDVVILDEDVGAPRGQWPLALITDLVHSKDGKIRSVLLKSRSGRVLQRPISKVIPVEVPVDEVNRKINATDDHQEGFQAPADHQIEPQVEAAHGDPEIGVPNRRRQLPRAAKNEVHYREFPVLLPRSLPILLCLCAIACSLPSTSASLLSCIDGGVRIQSSAEPTLIPGSPAEVCVNSRHCSTYLSQVEPQELFFSPANTLNAYNVHWRSIVRGVQLTESLSCPGADICSLIRCTFCADLIGNPHCWPLTAIAVIMLSVYFVITVSCFTITCLSRSVRTCMYRTTMAVANWLRIQARRWMPRRRRRSAEDDLLPLYEGEFMLRPSKFGTIAVICIALALPFGSACDAVSTFDSSLQVCDQQDPTGNCTFRHSTTFSFSFRRPEICLRLKKDNLFGSEVRIRLTKIRLQCQPVIQYFTRNHKLETTSSKRCHFAGSCTSEFCRLVSSRTFIPELDHLNDRPGISRCDSSCGGLGCGCALPLPGCLYSRTVAKPVDDVVFKKVNCPIWTEKVEVNYTELLPSGTYISHRFLLRPQVPFTFRSTTITVDFVTVPTLPLLGNDFLVSTRTTAPIAVRVPQDAPIALRCPSEEDAKAMNSSNCQLLDTCHCSRSETENRCHCDSVNITSLSESLDFRLPVSSAAARLSNVDQYISAETFSSVAEVSLEYTGQMESLLVQSDKCLATAKPFVGCFSCLHGAQSEVTCRSEKATIGTLMCADRTFALSCAPAGSPTILRIQHDKAKFEDRCNLTCGSGSQELVLHGLLTFHPEWDHESESSAAPSPHFLNFVNIPDLSHIGAFLESWWWTSSVCLVVVLVAVTTTLVVAPRIIGRLLPCIFPAAKIAGKLL